MLDIVKICPNDLFCSVENGSHLPLINNLRFLIIAGCVVNFFVEAQLQPTAAKRVFEKS